MNNNRTFVLKALVALIFAFVSITVMAQKPEIAAVDKVSGSYDELVTIKGSGFGVAPIVYFGADKVGTIVSATDQLLEVKIPAGTTFDHISVINTTSKLTGYSHDPFLISFGGANPFSTANLGAEQHFQSEAQLYDHCICDLNRDGRVDMATANRGSNKIVIFMNSSPIGGAISFNAPTTVTVDAPTLQITCGDLNSDGWPDLVASESVFGTTPTSRVFILQNNNGAGFLAPQTFSFTLHRVSKVEIADLDRDGRPEVLVGDQYVDDVTDPNKPGKIGVLINNSNGPISFSGSMNITIPKGTVPAFQSTDAIIAQDLNGDKFPELVTSQYGANDTNIAIIPNTSVPGVISFGAPTKLPTFADGVRDIRVGDLDGDGKPEIVFSGISTGRVVILNNTSSGSTINFSTPILFPYTQGAWGVDIGDLDGDSKPDIVVSNVTSTNFLILNNNSTPGNFAFTSLTVPTTYVNRHSRIGDLNGDGKPDISITSVDRGALLASKVTVFRNNSCVIPKISPATTPIRLCTAVVPYTLTATMVKGAFYQWFKDGASVSTCALEANTFPVSAVGTANYTVKIFPNGCAAVSACNTESAPVNITVVSAAGVTVTPKEFPTGVCLGSALTLGIVGEVAGYNYRWTGPNNFEALVANPTVTTNFQAMHAGIYTVETTVPAGNCVASIETIEVKAKAAVSFQISPAGNQTICQGAPALALSVVNNADYNYQWKHNGSNVGTNSSTYSVPSIASSSGDYTLTATLAAGGCDPFITPPVKVTVASLPAATFTRDPSGDACSGELVKFTGANNAAGANYEWDFGDGKPKSTEQNPSHTFESASGATFNVTLKVSFGGACPASTVAPIVIKPAPNMEITTNAPDYTICPDETITLSIDNSFSNPVWSHGSNEHSITVSAAGIYTVTAEASNGCVLTEESENVNKLPAPGIIITADPQQINEGATSQLNASGLNNYEWSPAETLSATDIEDPIASPLTTTTYTVTGTDGSGCTGTATIQVTVLGEAVVNKLEPKNFFSPNNSGHNDQWTIDKILDFPQCEVTIYDDKGVKVFSAKPYQNDWAGVYNGKELPDGVYFYIIRCDGEENSPRTGSITLIR